MICQSAKYRLNTELALVAIELAIDRNMIYDIIRILLNLPWDLWSNFWPLAWDHFVFDDPIRSLWVSRTHQPGSQEPETSDPRSAMQLK